MQKFLAVASLTLLCGITNHARTSPIHDTVVDSPNANVHKEWLTKIRSTPEEAMEAAKSDAQTAAETIQSNIQTTTENVLSEIDALKDEAENDYEEGSTHGEEDETYDGDYDYSIIRYDSPVYNAGYAEGYYETLDDD